MEMAIWDLTQPWKVYVSSVYVRLLRVQKEYVPLLNANFTFPLLQE